MFIERLLLLSYINIK